MCPKSRSPSQPRSSPVIGCNMLQRQPRTQLTGRRNRPQLGLACGVRTVRRLVRLRRHFPNQQPEKLESAETLLERLDIDKAAIPHRSRRFDRHKNYSFRTEHPAFFRLAATHQIIHDSQPSYRRFSRPLDWYRIVGGMPVSKDIRAYDWLRSSTSPKGKASSWHDEREKENRPPIMYVLCSAAMLLPGKLIFCLGRQPFPPSLRPSCQCFRQASKSKTGPNSALWAMCRVLGTLPCPLVVPDSALSQLSRRTTSKCPISDDNSSDLFIHLDCRDQTTAPRVRCIQPSDPQIGLVRAFQALPHGRRRWVPQTGHRTTAPGIMEPFSASATACLIPVSRLESWTSGWLQALSQY